MEVEIRRAERGDEPMISSVLLAAFMQYVSLYTPEAFAATTPTGDQIEGLLEEGPIWVAVAEHAVVGTVGAVVDDGGLNIRGLGVRPIVQGQNLGALLMEAVELYAREHRLEKMRLSTTPFLDEAIALYERLGFRRIEQGPHELYGTPIFTMEKSLGTEK